MKIKVYFFILFGSFGGIVACNNQVSNSNLENDEIPKIELSSQELELREKLKAATNYLLEVAKNPQAFRELKYAIEYSTKEFKTDERTSFANLFDDNAAYKISWTEKAKNSSEFTSFKQLFRQVKLKKKNSSSYSVEEIEDFLISENIEIYFPYSENWINEEVIPTLTYHPLDNEHENEGFQLIDSKDKQKSTNTSSYNEVTVNDDYAYYNPTYIVLPPPDDGGGSGGSGGGSSGSANTYNIDVDSDENTTPQVKLGYIRLTQQLDGLYRGGSDLRFLFVDVVEIEPGKIEARDVLIKKDLTRPDVREKRWKEIQIIADYRFHEYQKTLPLYAYEHDGGAGEGEITFDYTVKDSNGNTLNLKSTHDISKNRDGIQNFYFDRAVYLSDNKNDGGAGLKDGYQIYKANRGLSFTLPHRMINLN